MQKSEILSRRNISALNLLLCAGLFLLVLLTGRDIVSDYFEKKKTLRKTTAAPVDTEAAYRKIPFEDYSPVLKNNPFGFPGGNLRVLTVVSGSRAQKTDFVLIGTVVGPRELTYAVFKDNSGMQEVFRIGESVFGLGTLSVVKRDRAIIKKGDSTFDFLLEDVKVREIAKPASMGGAPSGFAQRIGRGTYMVDQARLQQAITNPGQMMTDARLKPNFVDGREEGFILSEVKPGGIYQSLGLQDGDVLLRINEYDISDPERALQAFTALRGLDRVQVDLIRSGARMTMTYQIK